MREKSFVYLTRSAKARATVDGLAAVTGLAKADAQRVLRTATPVPLGPGDESFLAKLRAAGLDGVVVEAGELKAWIPTPVRSVEFGPPVAVVAAGPLPLLAELESVDTIVLGKVHSRRETRTQTHVDPYAAAGATYLAFGTPGVPRSPETPVVPSLDIGEETFIALIGAESWILKEHSLDYRATLGKPEATRERSMKAVLERLRAAFPTAHYDDTLYRRPGRMSPPERRSRSRDNVLAHTAVTETASSSRDHAYAAAWLIHRTRA